MRGGAVPRADRAPARSRRAHGGNGGTLELVCGCGDEECTTPIRATPAGYESVRGESTDFAVLAGHAVHEVEDIVAERESFTVVRKRGDAAEIASEADRRS